MRSPALLVTGQNQIELGEVEIPDPGPGELLIKSELSSISPGTELRCMGGGENGGNEYPYIPGYSMLGTVQQVGAGATLPIGTRVFCSGTKKAEGAKRQWGGHVAYGIQTEKTVHLVPEGLSPESAVLTKLAAISFHGYRMVMAGALDDVLIIGLGPIGMLSSMIHQAAGANVMALDPIEARRDLAGKVGIKAFAPDDPAAKDCFPQLATVVVDSTGAPAVLPSALSWLREPAWGLDRNPRHHLIVQGSYGQNDIAVCYQEAFMREATIVVPRDTCPPDYDEVLSWCAAGKLDLAPLLSEVFAPKDAPEVYRRLLEKDPALLTAGFRWA